MFNRDFVRGYPTDTKLRNEWLEFDRDITALRRPRQCIQIYFDDSDAPVTVSKDKMCGGPAKISTDEAEDQLTYRFGSEIKIYIVVGGERPGRPLKWGPPKDMDLVELGKRFVLRCSQNDCEIDRI